MEQRGISKLDLKRQNRLQILRVVHENGAISRVDIASQLQLTRAAVTIITNEMISEGVLQELGEAPIELDKLQKGRRKILIGINATNKFALGATISEGYVSVGLSTLDAEVLDKAMMPIGEETTNQDVMDFIVSSCNDMISNSCLSKNKILGLGVAVMPNMWSKMRIRIRDGALYCRRVIDPLQKALELPVLCGNAVGLLAMATQDHRTHEGKRFNHILLTMGEQINLAVLNQNNLMADYQIHTNRVERMIVRPGGKACPDYSDGSVKAELAEHVLIESIKGAYSQETMPYLYNATSGDRERITEELFNDAYTHGDKGVQEIAHYALDTLAVLINNLICAHYADKVVLHNCKMNEYCFDYLKNKLAELLGVEDVNDMLEFSRADGRYSFLAGCALSIYELFYIKGGL